MCYTEFIRICNLNFLKFRILVDTMIERAKAYDSGLQKGKTKRSQQHKLYIQTMLSIDSDKLDCRCQRSFSLMLTYNLLDPNLYGYKEKSDCKKSYSEKNR